MNQKRTGSTPPHSESVFSKVCGIFTFKAAREQNRLINELREEVATILRTTGIEDDHSDYDDLNHAAKGAYGNPVFVLRNLIAYFPRHSVEDITEACLETFITMRPEIGLLPEDYIIVSERLRSAYINSSDFTPEPFNGGKSEEYRKTMRYAMENIEDGHLIVSMVRERGIGTLEEMIDLLPVLKRSGHSSLTEGLL